MPIHTDNPIRQTENAVFSLHGDLPPHTAAHTLCCPLAHYAGGDLIPRHPAAHNSQSYLSPHIPFLIRFRAAPPATIRGMTKRDGRTTIESTTPPSTSHSLLGVFEEENASIGGTENSWRGANVEGDMLMSEPTPTNHLVTHLCNREVVSPGPSHLLCLTSALQAQETHRWGLT